MLKKHSLCNLALSISGALLLSACGGGSGDSDSAQTSSNVYRYSNLTPCADTDSDGTCSTYEQQIAFTGDYANIVNDDGAILTAPKGSDLVSPFTTLIHSEMLFNPTLNGEPAQASSYLQTALGDKVGVNFSTASSTQGPKEQTETLLQSLRQAQTQGEHGPMLNIAHALDVMIANQTLDLSGFDLRNEPNRHVSLDGQLIIHGSQTDSSLTGAKSVAFNPANNKIVLVDSAESVKQIDITNTNSSELAELQAARQLQEELQFDAYSSASSHDDDDDDDDDDHYDWETILDLLGQQAQEHKLVQIVPALNGVQSYKLYQPKNSYSSNNSKTCTKASAESSSGVFLASLYENKPQAASHTQKIDAYASASGSVPLPKPKPTPLPKTTDKRAKGCFNDNFNWIKPLYSQNVILAELDGGYSSPDQLRRLKADSLSMGSESFALSSTQNVVVPSLDETELLVVDDGGSGNAVLLNSRTLRETRPATIAVTNASTATFAANNQLLFGLKSNKIIWVEKTTAATQLASLDVDSTVRILKTSPNGEYSAAVTNNSLYILNNNSRTKVKKVTLEGSDVKELFVLNNKAVTVHSDGLNYVQFSDISGPKLKVAAQLMTSSFKDEWAEIPGMDWGPRRLSNILEMKGVSESVYNQFLQIDIEWLPTEASQVSDVTGVNISGLERGTWVTLYKDL